MSDNTKIEWSDASWNPVTGCTEVSLGCDHCYAKTLAERFRGTPGHYFENGFDIQLRPDKLTLPLMWREPRRVFVNSMSDLFHQDIPDEYILQVWQIMARTPQHTYQILTKRHARMRSFVQRLAFAGPTAEERTAGIGGRVPYLFTNAEDNASLGPVRPLDNVWLGVSVETQQWADIRIPALLMTPAAVRFLSCEPLLGPLDLTRIAYTDGGGTHLDVVNGFHGVPDLWTAPGKRIDWVIVGGESGRSDRPMHPAWARSIRDACLAAGVAFLFKQHGEWAPLKRSLDYVTDDDRVQVVSMLGGLGGRPWSGHAVQDGWRDAEVMRRYGKHNAGRELDGRTWDEFPTEVSV